MNNSKIYEQIKESGTLLERLKQCNKRIAKMCSERRPPRITIPAYWEDDDLFITTTIREAIQILEDNFGKDEKNLDKD